MGLRRRRLLRLAHKGTWGRCRASAPHTLRRVSVGCAHAMRWILHRRRISTIAAGGAHSSKARHARVCRLISRLRHMVGSMCHHVVDEANCHVHGLCVTFNGHLARHALGHVLVDLDAGAGAALEVIDCFPAAANDPADDVPGAIKDLSVGDLPDRPGIGDLLLHEMNSLGHLRRHAGDGDLSWHAFGEILVDLDAAAGLHLQELDSFAALADDTANCGLWAVNDLGDLSRAFRPGHRGAHNASGQGPRNGSRDSSQDAWGWGSPQ
mmetsp:Transcript_9777/g.27652  ORF Transcript_9777/g.27652 Transcript_9777/m.27652 type:complete len:266 (+) Transcript_9777:1437-2234(+)